MKPGDIIKFRYVHNGSSLNYKTALYIGESPIHRSDGVTVLNHEVLIFGDSRPCTIDKNLLRYMSKVNESR